MFLSGPGILARKGFAGNRMRSRAGHGRPARYNRGMGGMDRPLQSRAIHRYAAGPGSPLVLLHGFTGSPLSWAAVARALPANRAVVAPCLPGHHPDLPVAQGFGANIERMAEILADLDGLARPCHLVGYSLGARVALGLALGHGHLIARLTLIGVHPGLASEAERARRRAADQAWIACLRERGMDEFARAWQAQALFASQARHPIAVREQHAIRLAHDPAALALSLEHMGLGVMPDHGARVAELGMPVTLVSGALDSKFTALARDLAARIPCAQHRVIAGCGHNPLLERPDELAALLAEAG
jgi:2-succinyl-6-hydroxy-2,4-cyclohexadiene-1-carboxylate synthase